MKRSERFDPRGIHVSWLIAWASVGVVLGIAAAAFFSLGFHPLHYILVSAVFFGLGFYTRTRAMIGMVLIAGFMLGFWRGEALQQHLYAYEQFIGQEVQLSGIIAEDTTIGKGGDQRIRLRSVSIEGIDLPGEVWLSADSVINIKRSDKVTVFGQLREGFGTLPASMFRAEIVRVERIAYGDVAREVRDWFANGVRVAIPEPQSSLGIGFLLGQRSLLPEDLEEQLRLLGLTHVVVASGYNLTILVRFARAAFARVSKYLAFMSASAMIASFLLITGLSPSMSRAALVAGLSLLAWYVGRSIHPIVLLFFAAAVTALLQPLFVWGDLGWYLSFASFAGVMLLAPLLQHYFWGLANEPGVIRRITIETLSAQLLTLPLIAFVFGQYSPLALPANLFVLPLIPFTMALTFVAGIGGLVVPTFAWLLGLPAWFLLSYMTTMTGWLSKLPWASGEISIGISFLVGGYIAIVGLVFYLWIKTKHNFKNDNIIV